MPRRFIIGDIHGCSTALAALLERLQPDEKQDELILLGDLFDRGPDSWDVLQNVKKLANAYGQRFTLLLGNHEQFLLAPKLTLNQRMVWEMVGRSATAASFKRHKARMEDAAPWLSENCALFYRGDDLQCVHAGLVVENIEDNDQLTIVQDHDVVKRNQYKGRLTVVGHIALDMPTWFQGDGQTALLPYGEWLNLPDHGIICIDTGCGKGGRLTGMTVDGGRYKLDFVNGQ